jgi:hypothetical protein
MHVEAQALRTTAVFVLGLEETLIFTAFPKSYKYESVVRG